MKAWTLAISLFSVALAGTLLTPACSPTVHDPLACQDGDCSHQTELTFCDIDGVHATSGLSNECIARPSANACNRVVGCPTETPHCTDESDGECRECLDDTHCTTGTALFCNAAGTCVDEEQFSCDPANGGDAACVTETNGDKPYCQDTGTGGLCVVCTSNDHCTTNAAKAICDSTGSSATYECRGCDTEMADTDCPDTGLCSTKDDGVCVATAEVIYVAAAGMASGNCDTTANGCTIMHGLTKVDAARDVLLLATGNYDENVIVDNMVAAPVWMVADGDVTINPGLTGNQKVLLVTGGATVELVGIVLDPGAIDANTDIVRCELTSDLKLKDVKVLGASGVGIVANNCTLTVRDGSTVSGNTGGGITATGGTLNVLQSTVSGNTGGGIAVSGTGDFTIENNFIAFNGNGSAGPSVALTTGSATSKFNFNTVVGSQVGNGAASTGVICSLNTDITATGNIVYDGLSASEKDAVSGTSCIWEYSNIERGGGGTNIDADPKLELSVIGPTGNYHLKMGSPCIGMGGTAGPDLDIDGDPRTTSPGDLVFDIGADEFVSQ